MQVARTIMVLKEHKNAVITWLWSGIFLVVLMVVIGGITRLTGSGLSIVRWDVISGTIPPLTEAKWMETFEEYKQFPEYQKLNYNMTLEGFKNIFWWEYIHRLIGRFIGIVFIVPFIYFLAKKSFSKETIKHLIFILLLGMAQGVMGWIMVKSGLQENPHVSHYRLAMHLSLALLLVGTILWLILRINSQERLKDVPSRTTSLSMPLMVLAILFVQIILGAFVAGLKAGYSFNSFPLMNNSLLPDDVFGFSDSIFSNGVFIQFVHRWFAWVVAGAYFVMWLKLRAGSFSREVQLYANLLLSVCLLQVVAGIATLVWRVPLVMGVLHQLLAVILFGLTVAVIFYLKYNPSFISTAHIKAGKPRLQRKFVAG